MKTIAGLRVERDQLEPQYSLAEDRFAELVAMSMLSLFNLKMPIGVCLKRGGSEALPYIEPLFRNYDPTPPTAKGTLWIEGEFCEDKAQVRTFPPTKHVQGSHEWVGSPWISPLIRGTPESAVGVQHG